MYTAKVITVSDRSFRGERPDEGGPAVEAILREAGYEILPGLIVPDEVEEIKKALCQAAEEDVAFIVTTGGTGFAPRDVTPEATLAVVEKVTPGIPEAMRAASMAITPRGCLSRSAAGILKRSLIINLPGSPKAAKENLEAVLDPIAHGLIMLRGKPMNCAEIKD
ncbi:MAG: MogA/MoaB family molybdenum cofactor biosynthesis protein [Lachnospiraceae bacterium]|nr:MogA/MoaB family molybdenum cofactor biosynthesis protein [Lachnospiraceae bacterium]